MGMCNNNTTELCEKTIKQSMLGWAVTVYVYFSLSSLSALLSAFFLRGFLRFVVVATRNSSVIIRYGSDAAMTPTKCHS